MSFSINNTLAVKRHGGTHSSDDIKSLIQGFMSGDVADYQMSAWLMAVCINGLDAAETSALTRVMVESGDTIDLSDMPLPTVDKHSTGGVGDKTTLVLAPLLAAAGMIVAKMSGRGLGITGGTVDKMESIPGFSPSLSREQFLGQARTIGCVMAGHTANLVPADKKIYALRDVTATVDSVPLIAASVMSKKIAAGAKTILLDVKMGNGAFMRDIDSARELARTMIDIGNSFGRRTVAAITSMHQPLGMAVGNAVEVAEAIDTLKGNGPSDLRELCIELGAISVSAATESSDMPGIKANLESLLDSGAAFDKFRQVVSAQSGDISVLDNVLLLPQPIIRQSVTAAESGFVESVNALRIGQAAMMLGAGRRKAGDSIDPTAGVVLRKKIGDAVVKGEEIAVLTLSRDGDTDAAKDLVFGAFSIGQRKPKPSHLIYEILGL